MPTMTEQQAERARRSPRQVVQGAHAALRPRDRAPDGRRPRRRPATRLEERGSLSVLVFRPSSEGHVEEVWGWEAYDDLLLDFVRRLKAFQTDGIVPAGHLLPAVRALGRDHPLRQSPRAAAMIGGADRARAEGRRARPADPRATSPSARTFRRGSAPSSAPARIMKDPKHRIERLVYRGVQEARDQVTRQTVRARRSGAASCSRT